MCFRWKRTLLSMFMGLSATSLAGSAAADMLVNNNIQGKVRFSNTHPGVVSLLQGQLGMSKADLTGTSTSPTGFTTTGTAVMGTPIERNYLLSAESGGGVTWTLNAIGLLYASPGYTASGGYTFSPVTGVLLNPPPDPGTTQDIEECVGVVQIKFGLDPACTIPFVVGQGAVPTSRGYSQFSNSSYHYVVKQGDTSENVSLLLTMGTDPMLDTITVSLPITLNALCDEDIEEICIDMSPYVGGGDQLGSLTGPFDVLGETEQGSTYIKADAGPSGNLRYGYFTPPEMPEAVPASWWTLPNMVPGNYYGVGQTVIRTGRQTTYLMTPRIGPPATGGPLTVVQGVSSENKRTIGGQDRYPFVMTPAVFHGSILLADPYVTLNPGATSPLSALEFPTLPPNGNPSLTVVLAKGTATSAGTSVTSFDGAFDPATGVLASGYELPVVNPYDMTLDWQEKGLRLKFNDPPTHLNGSIDMVSDGSSHPLGPGDTVQIDHAYCFNDVVLSYTLTNGDLFNPTASVTGGFTGTDWLGNATSYTGGGIFNGMPNTLADAAPTGEVRMALPQGTYTIQPGASVVIGGTVSTSTFAPSTLTLGCGQRLTLGLETSISLDDLPPCASSPDVDITGTVASNGAAVDKIWYQVNGGNSILICSNCGPDPAYNATVALEACTNTIEIFALVNGQTVSVTDQIIWDDPTDNIECPGGCGSVEPPPSTCADVEVEAIACADPQEGNGSGYALTFQVTNNTDQPMLHVLLDDAHVSPDVVSLDPPLAPGESRVIDVMLIKVNPGSGFCFDVGFITEVANEGDEECCWTQVCVEAPTCCFAVDQEDVACMPGEPAGTFTYSFDMTNKTNDNIEHVVVIPPDGVTVSPQHVDIPTTVPGGTAQVGPLTFTGGIPGKEMCVLVAIHNDADEKECCTEEVCFTVPKPCAEEPPNTLKAPESAMCSTGAAGGTGGAQGTVLTLGLAALGVALRRRRRG